MSANPPYIGQTALTEFRGMDSHTSVCWRMTTVEKGQTLHRYRPSACPHCPLKSQCTPSPYRRVTRREHEQVLDDMRRRLDRTPEASRIRRQTVEHPFGTPKPWMESNHFLTRALPRVRTDMSLQVMAYNLKRMLQIFGTSSLDIHAHTGPWAGVHKFERVEGAMTPV